MLAILLKEFQGPPDLAGVTLQCKFHTHHLPAGFSYHLHHLCLKKQCIASPHFAFFLPIKKKKKKKKSQSRSELTNFLKAPRQQSWFPGMIHKSQRIIIFTSKPVAGGVFVWLVGFVVVVCLLVFTSFSSSSSYPPPPPLLPLLAYCV